MDLLPLPVGEFHDLQMLKEGSFGRLQGLEEGEYINYKLLFNGNIQNGEECPAYLDVVCQTDFFRTLTSTRVLVKFGDGQRAALHFKYADIKSVVHLFLKMEQSHVLKAGASGISKLRMMAGNEVKDLDANIAAETFRRKWDAMQDRYETACRKMINGDEF